MEEEMIGIRVSIMEIGVWEVKGEVKELEMMVIEKMSQKDLE